LKEGPTEGSGSPSDDDLVAGKYELVRLIGRGGMGSVWEGRHVTLGTRVACKFIDGEFAAKSPDARTRFKNEARAAASLRSKHVVDVHDYGVMKDGRPYIVMEYLSGESLADRLERLGRLPLATTARIVSQIGRALQKAHAAGIVHRDLKPDNVFLMWDEEDEQDQVKVVDFGIAKFTDEGVNVSHATQTGSVVGTPFFMSPEQARGIDAIDLRSDLWALGVVAFQCLTGRLPFYSEAVGDLLIKICTDEVPVPSHVSPDLPLSMDAWMARALERDRDLRFQSAREMTGALADAIGPVARTLLESHADEEGAQPRPRLHLTAGPRAGQVVTGSSHPPSVLAAGGRPAATAVRLGPKDIAKYAPATLLIALVVAITGVWLLSGPGEPADLASQVPRHEQVPPQVSHQPKGAAPAAVSVEVEGTPLSELAVEPAPSPKAGGSPAKAGGARAPATGVATSPSPSSSGGAEPTRGPGTSPQRSTPPEPPADGAPAKDLDVGLGY
jgi:eukaryotic-like serine/threonine-protein kinase